MSPNSTALLKWIYAYFHKLKKQWMKINFVYSLKKILSGLFVGFYISSALSTFLIPYSSKISWVDTFLLLAMISTSLYHVSLNSLKLCKEVIYVLF